MNREDLWLCSNRVVRGRVIREYVQIRDAGPIPPGVALYRTKHLAKAAVRYIDQHPSRPMPPDLVPVETT